MFISLLGKGSETLLHDFDAANISYVVHHPPVGVIMNAGETIEILQVVIPSVALVVAAWINGRSSRKAILTMKDNKIEHLEGRTVEDIESLMKMAQKIMIIETKKPNE